MFPALLLVFPGVAFAMDSVASYPGMLSHFAVDLAYTFVLTIAVPLFLLAMLVKVIGIIRTRFFGDRVFVGGYGWVDREVYITALRDVHKRVRNGEYADNRTRREMRRYRSGRWK